MSETTKRLVVCCDGTWMTRIGGHGDNVSTVADAVVPTALDEVLQQALYISGVGSGSLLDHIRGGAFGFGLDKNIREGYEFLAEHYEDGAQIFLFGFSRGAYTARSLAGLIRTCGLLKHEFADCVDDAFDLYRRRGDRGGADSESAIAFRDQFSVVPGIHFIGVWDTVGALGVPAPLGWLNGNRYRFHDVELSGKIGNAFQALAIDERRRNFQPTFWQDKPKPGQHVEQRWFAGIHGDVGGAAHPDRGLGDCSLDFIANAAIACGLDLDVDKLGAAGLPDPLGKLHRNAWYWRPTEYAARTIRRSATVAVSDAARFRFEDPSAHYHPANLAVALAAR